MMELHVAPLRRTVMLLRKENWKLTIQKIIFHYLEIVKVFKSLYNIENKEQSLKHQFLNLVSLDNSSLFCSSTETAPLESEALKKLAHR